MIRRCTFIIVAISVFVFQACPLVADDLQPKRKAFIQKAIDQGIFEKVEIPGSLPRLWVTPVFQQLTFDQKQTFVSVVYAYYYTENPKYDVVRIYDSQTGKAIGSYSQTTNGLDLK